MLQQTPSAVKICEVGPRDGLQNEEIIIGTSDKIRIIEALAAAGITNIEATSFVSPKWIPQLADGLEVAARLRLPPQVMVSSLVPNLEGYESARKAGLQNIAVFMSATEKHNRKNINKGTAEALNTVAEVVRAAHSDKLFVRAYLSVVFVCPYEGKVSREQAASIASRLIAVGIDELSLGDTIGAAVPAQIGPLLALVSKEMPLNKIALHFHDTYGMALANVLAGLDYGVSIFDSSVGGLGGCPYAPGAAGNLATEDLVYMLHGFGIKTGVDLDKLVEAGALTQSILKKKLPGRYLQACLSKKGAEADRPSS